MGEGEGKEEKVFGRRSSSWALPPLEPYPVWTLTTLDLPPVVPPRTAGTLPGPGGQPGPRFMDQQQQQRPSLSYFIFLSILFYLVSNQNDGGGANFGDDGALERMRAALARREHRRDGLAVWLGVNATYEAPQNGTNAPSQLIEFAPVDHANPVLLPTWHALMDRKDGRAFYPQNLTGFVKGRWGAEDWSFERLGLEEVYNTTTLREEVPEKLEEEEEAGALEEVGEEKDKLEEPRDLGEEQASSAKAFVRRQLVDADPILANATDLSNSTLPTMVNVTVSTNRTLSRADFAWLAGGKVSFNLREEQTSIGGAVEAPEGREEDNGKLVEMKEGRDEDWEKEGPVTYLRGDVTLSSKDGQNDFVLDIEAVHFLSQGTVFGFATPSYVSTHIFEIPILPAFDTSRSNASSLAAGHTILQEVDRRIVRDRLELERNGAGASSFADQSIGALCTFTLHASLSPLPPSFTPTLYTEYYASLFHPTGSSLRAPPTPRLSYSLYSENCGLVLSGEGEVLPSPRLWERATSYAALMGLVQFVLVVLLVRQMEFGRSPSGAAKVAYSTVAMQAAMDSYFFIITFTVGVVTDNRSSVPLLVPGFFALISSLLFGMRYASDIRAAMPPDPVRPPPSPPPPPPTREALSAAAAERRAATEDEEETPLLDETAAPVVPVVARAERDLSHLFAGLALLVFLACLAVIIFWSWVGLIVALLYSYWVPQIVLNVSRGAARMALKKEYVVGVTIARLVLPLYIWGCPANVLSVETSRWVYVLVLYSFAQAALLLAQDSHLGARFFLPRFFLPSLGLTDAETWDYHPLLAPSDVEGGQLPEDCPICLEPIVLGDKEDRELGMAGRARWAYMCPPCHHVAHTECLESWLAIKSVCPVCRGRLPPL